MNRQLDRSKWFYFAERGWAGINGFVGRVVGLYSLWQKIKNTISENARHLFTRFTFIILILTTTPCWSQVTVTGTVIFKDDRSAAPGVNVVEKGTSNGTNTRNDGSFKLTVSDPNAVLVFSFSVYYKSNHQRVKR